MAKYAPAAGPDPRKQVLRAAGPTITFSMYDCWGSGGLAASPSAGASSSPSFFSNTEKVAPLLLLFDSLLLRRNDWLFVEAMYDTVGIFSSPLATSPRAPTYTFATPVCSLAYEQRRSKMVELSLLSEQRVAHAPRASESSLFRASAAPRLLASAASCSAYSPHSSAPSLAAAPFLVRSLCTRT